MRRDLTFGGVALSSLGGMSIDSELSVIGDAEPRYLEEALPYRDGTLEMSKADGTLHYDRRTLTYVINVMANSPQMLESKRSQLATWLKNGACGDLLDTYEPGWKFTDVRPRVNGVTIISRNYRAAKIQLQLTADPYMQSTSTPTSYRL